MSRWSFILLIVVVLLQSSFLDYPIIHLSTNIPSYEINQRVSINMPLKITQENASLDTTAPIITRPADVSYLVNTTDHNITWYIADKNPRNYSIQHNYQYIESEWDKTWSENQSISISVDNLSIGIHLYTIIVEDSWNNTNSDDVLVTVKEIAYEPTFENANDNPTNLANMASFFFIIGISLSIILVIFFRGIRHRRRQDFLPNLPPEDPLELESWDEDELL